MEPKYRLIEAAEQEKNDFMKKFNELLNETEMYFEPVPQFARKDLTSPWEVQCQIFLQKKETIKEESVPSPFTNETSTKA